MFVGHYSVAFAAGTERNRIPLWVLLVAVQFLDYIWATLVLLGIGKPRVITPLTDKATAMGVWIFYTLFVGIAFLVEKIGRGKQTNVA